jgi:organic radical activating enzyme
VKYAIKAVFNTLQGEGARAGARSVFVRFVACNLWSGDPAKRAEGKGACAAWCDTSFVGGEHLTTVDLCARMNAEWPEKLGEERWCVLTGGEPLLQVNQTLLDTLHYAGWKVAVETNGTVWPLAGGLTLDWICVSPKKSPLPVLIKRAHEVKVVLPGAGGDFAGWTDEELEGLRSRIQADHYFVQPQDPIDPAFVEVSHLHGHGGDGHQRAVYRANLARCIEFVRTHPDWRLGCQLHKFWNLP